MTKEVGTLAEIGAKPGDTVMLVENGIIAGEGVGKLGVVIEGDDGVLYTRGYDMCRGDTVATNSASYPVHLTSKRLKKLERWRKSVRSQRIS